MYYTMRKADFGSVRRCIGFLFAVLLPLGAACDQGASESRRADKDEEGDSNGAVVEKSACLVSPLAGKWYPAASDVLKEQIQGLLDKAEKKSLPRIQALILPHAGYRWCGSVLAQGVKQLEKYDIERVILLGPSHKMRLKNTVSVPEVGAYKTPLGRTPLDKKVINQLKKASFVKSVARAHQGEHSVQIELPFLQVAFDSFKIIPVVTGKLDDATARKIAELLGPHVNEKTLVVVSSDFIHYGQPYQYVPFSENIENNLEKLTRKAWERIAALDAAGFRRYMTDTGATICGADPIAILLHMFSSDTTRPVMLDYGTSAERSGNYRRCVTYLSGAFVASSQKRETAAKNACEGDVAFDLSETEQDTLLSLARKTLRYRLEKGEMPGLQAFNIDITEKLRKKRAAFVTLKKKGRLRGCIGDLQAKKTLYQSVMKRAVSAALADPRFKPVASSELSDLKIEISVLTSPRPIDSWKKIEIGKHGVILRKGLQSGVYLPHVAPEQGWNREEMLRHLSKKAGLAPNAWQSDVSLSVFRAIAFSEDE